MYLRTQKAHQCVPVFRWRGGGPAKIRPGAAGTANLQQRGAGEGLQAAERIPQRFRTGGGKPYFPAFPGFHYNISHSGSYVVCAVCDQPVGIDLQQIPDQTERAVKIAKRFFSQQEQEALQELRGRNETGALCRLFCRYWTARESYIKLTGRGLSEPFENFRPDLEAGVILVLKRDSNDTSETFYLSEYPAPAGYCLTVCSTVPLLYEQART